MTHCRSPAGREGARPATLRMDAKTAGFLKFPPMLGEGHQFEEIVYAFLGKETNTVRGTMLEHFVVPSGCSDESAMQRQQGWKVGQMNSVRPRKLFAYSHQPFSCTYVTQRTLQIYEQLVVERQLRTVKRGFGARNTCHKPPKAYHKEHDRLELFLTAIVTIQRHY